MKKTIITVFINLIIMGFIAQPVLGEDKEVEQFIPSVDSQYLLDQFKADAKSAKEKYKDKPLKVSGFIKEIGKSGKTWFVVICTHRHHGNTMKNLLKCYLSKVDEKQIKKFTTGHYVSVTGVLYIKKGEKPTIKKGEITRVQVPNSDFNKKYVPPKYKKCTKCNGFGFIRRERSHIKKKRLMSYTKKVKCPSCKGRGEVKISSGHYKKLK